MANVAVGIEIHQNAMRLVQLKKSRSGPSVTGLYRQPLEDGVINEEGIQDRQTFQRAVQQLFEESGAGKVNVCLSIVSERIDVRTLQLPQMPDRDLRQAIRWELDRLLHLNEDIFFDYHPVDKQAQGGAHSHVVVSAPRRLIVDYLQAFQQVGIFPEMIDVGGFALPLCCPGEGSVGYISLGPVFAHMLFLKDGVYQLSRLVPLRLQALWRGESVEENGAALSHPAARDLIRTIIQTLEGAEELSDVSTLYVSGEGALVEGIIDMIGDETGIDAVAATPSAGVGIREALKDDGPAYAGAVGVALRGLQEL